MRNPLPDTFVRPGGLTVLLLAFLLMAGSCVERRPSNEAETTITPTAEPTATAEPEAGDNQEGDPEQPRRYCPPGPGVHADYGIEPTFETPEEAVRDANATHKPIETPESIEEYIVIQRADWWLDFEYVVDDELQHRWEIIRGDDGRWGMVALDYCGPDYPFY